MPDHIAWRDVRDFAQQQGCTQIIFMAWDGKRTHVVTWGETPVESLQAANGGNLLKETLGFPDRDYHDEPEWLKDLRKENADLKTELAGHVGGPPSRRIDNASDHDAP